jgi:hypothetical protein
MSQQDEIAKLLHGQPGAVLMACGHTAQSIGTRTVNGEKVSGPACVICAGIGSNEKAWTVAEDQPDLTGRLAFCSYRAGRGGVVPKCHETGVPSRVGLAFFSHHPDREHDEYYCGCWGWD